ncbi:MAG TPA: NAD(+)/NADH kinase [Clostridiaceae bacterium]|nr:NAD(+)/NADH kinase [Clostridiaceae bacterium]
MKNIGVNINTSKDPEGRILESVLKTIYEQDMNANVKIFKDSEGLENETSASLEALIVLGGDGTILGASRKIARYSVPILGMNIGHLGFLTECDSAEAPEAIKKLMRKEFHVEDRAMISCSFESQGEVKTYNALNEVVLSKGTLVKIIKYDVFVDDDFYGTFVSDGVLVSTATGSTAYNLSCGGPLVYPTLDAMILSPICPHSMNMRSMVLGSTVRIDVDLNKNSDNVFLTLDGQDWMELDKVKKVSIMASPDKCKLIRLDGSNYFKVLRKKITFRTKEGEGEEYENS